MEWKVEAVTEEGWYWHKMFKYSAPSIDYFYFDADGYYKSLSNDIPVDDYLFISGPIEEPVHQS